MIEPGPRVLVLSPPGPDGALPVGADLALVPPTSPPGPGTLVDLVGPDAVAALAATGDSCDVLVRPGPGPGPDGLALLRDAVAATRDAGRPAASVVLDLGLDAAADEADALVRLDATAELVALGHPVAVSLDGPAGSPAAVAVSAARVGARVLRVRPEGVRDARRAADVIAALLAERSGVVP